MDEIYRNSFMVGMSIFILSLIPLILGYATFCLIFLHRFINRRIDGSYQCKNKIIEVFKYLGVLCLIVILLKVLFLVWFGLHPAYVLILAMIAALILYNLLKKEHWAYWLSTLLLFAGIGLYLVFNNDLPGPFAMDMCSSTEYAQWFGVYRFYWCGTILEMTIYWAAPISIILLTLLKVAKLIKARIGKANHQTIDEQSQKE